MRKERVMKKAFISGVTGQDGAYLAKLLLDKGYEVVGGIRRTSNDNLTRLARLGITESLKLIDFDLSEPYGIQAIIRNGKFDEFYNLGAQSFVGTSFNLPITTFETNTNSVLNILDAIHKLSPATKFYQASTSEMFGKIQSDIQCENTPFYPRSPYGVSKLAAHWATKNYRESYGLFCVSGILFNHESPLRGVEFVTQKIATFFGTQSEQKDLVLKLGNLNAERDWGFAPEFVEGMWKMLQSVEPDDYVLATNTMYSVRDFAKFCAAVIGVDLHFEGEGLNEVGFDQKSGKVLIQVSEEFYRPAEVEKLRGNYSKAEEKLGWRPTTFAAKIAEEMTRSALQENSRGK